MWRASRHKPEVDAQTAVPSRSTQSAWAGVASSFVVIFVGEWGDITQIATANLAAKYHHPVSVGDGATFGLWAAALLAITAGRNLLRILSVKLLHRIGDAVEFFRRTYLTEGLRDLLSRALRRIGGDANASPVVNLQTNFGGGKTHSMLALFHVFSGLPLTAYPQDVQELLAGADLAELGPRVRRVVLVGNHLPAHGLDTKSDGTKINTIWGELAWQLGGRAAYDSIARADASAQTRVRH